MLRREYLGIVSFLHFITFFLLLGSIGAWETGVVSGMQLAFRLTGFLLLDMLFTRLFVKQTKKQRRSIKNSRALVYKYPSTERMMGNSVYALQAE